MDLFNYKRRRTVTVTAGDITLGSDSPIRIQSMTTTATADIDASVAQAERIADAGGELVRFTTQGRREAESMRLIRERLRRDGYRTPVVADVHFNPDVADVAALYSDKVRINPGNYVDPARTFREIDYTDEEYGAELRRLEERFVSFLSICRSHGTAVRIGVNHGSLSDRIMSRYGDTPEGIVESCMEFLRICKRERFDNVVISVKASNTVVMVRSVRLLVAVMEREGMAYPLHIGVTEAGEGEDGRIKSAVGIGALLSDGIGDTVRVSLSEEPEAEIPVARHLVGYVMSRADHPFIPAVPFSGFDYIRPTRRKTRAVGGIGGEHVPVVIVSSLDGRCDAVSRDSDEALVPDYIYVGGRVSGSCASGSSADDRRDKGARLIVDFDKCPRDCRGTGVYPIFPHNALPFVPMIKADMRFIVLQYGCDAEEYAACLRAFPETVVVCVSRHANHLGEQRALVHEMSSLELPNPVVFAQMYRHDAAEAEAFMIEAAADMGALMIDGLCDGVWLMNSGTLPAAAVVSTSFGLLQAARLRTSRTEYISCPGCGRTLYDLRGTIARIRAATIGMKGLKIAVMGCIVNGPGEMADADYGYVGAGRGMISLYRRKECVAKNIPEEEAVERLLALIRAERGAE